MKKPGIIGKQAECFQIILSLIKWKQHRARWSRDLDSGCISASPSAQEPGQVIAFQAPGLDHLKKGAIPSLVFFFFLKQHFQENMFIFSPPIMKQVKINLLFSPSPQLSSETAEASLLMTLKHLLSKINMRLKGPKFCSSLLNLCISIFNQRNLLGDLSKYGLFLEHPNLSP